MHAHNEPYNDPDLERQLDEAGRWCQARDAGWETLLARLPPRADLPQGTPGPGPGGPLVYGPAGGGWSWPAWLGAAVVVGVVLGFAVWAVRPGGFPERPTPAPQPPGVPIPADTAGVPVPLAAGCRIEPVGEVVYRPVEPRRVRLERGELYVEVDRAVAGPEPFVVETPAGEAKAIGTRFVVETQAVPWGSRHPPQTHGDPSMSSRLDNVQVLTRVLVLAGVVQLVNAELQMQGCAGQELKAEAVVAQPRPTVYFGLPGFWSLQQEAVRKEIELVPEQEQKLQQLAKQYQEKVQEVYAPLRSKDLPMEQRMALSKELGQKFQQLQEWANGEVKKVLLPHQVSALEMIELRNRAGGYLQIPMVLDRLGLTEAQKEKVRKNRSELAEKIQRLQKEAFEELMEILTPEQIEKLKQPSALFQPAPGGQGGSAPR